MASTHPAHGVAPRVVLRFANTVATERFLHAPEQFKLTAAALRLAKGRKRSKAVGDELQRRLRKVIEKYARTECSELARKTYDTLPRKLRDMIYTYLWDDLTAKEAFQGVRPAKLKDTPWLWQCGDKPCHCFRLREIPLWVHHQVVGMEMAREAAAAYYQAMPPNRIGPDIIMLRVFLTNDHFDLGLTPAAHSRRLQVTISPILCPKLGTGIKGKGGAEYNWILMSKDGQRLVRESLDSLEKVQHRSGFRLTIVFWEGIWGGWTEYTMEELRSVYDGCQQAGVRVRVYGRPSREDFPISRIDRYYSMPLGM